MAFKKIITTDKKTASWLDDGQVVNQSQPTHDNKNILSTIQPPVSTLDHNDTPSIDDKQPWRYSLLEQLLEKGAEPTYQHVFPHRLKMLITKYYDYQNWFETVWMCLILNNRWRMTEVLVPDHLTEKLGGNTLTLTIDETDTTVTWRIIDKINIFTNL